MEESDIYAPLSSELCEVIGLFIGDGFTNKYGSHYLIQFTGNVLEEEYYTKLIIPKMFFLFKLKPYIKKEKDCSAIRISYNSKCLFKMLTERFKFNAGKKSKSVLIPEEILVARKELLFATLRGIYDAEGYVYLDTRKMYKKPYPRIELRMNNPKILKQIYRALSNAGVRSYMRDEITLVIQGVNNVKSFVDIIGFSNKKHIIRLSQVLL